MEYFLDERERPWERGNFLKEVPPLPNPLPLKNFPTTLRPTVEVGLWGREDLGKGDFLKEVPPSQTHPPQELSHHAPSNTRSDFGLLVGRSVVGISFLGGFYFLSLIASYRLFEMKLTLWSQQDGGRRWHSQTALFFLQKKTLHPYIILPQKMLLFRERI